MDPTDSHPIETSDAQLDSYGAAAADFRIPRDAALGEHRVDVFVTRGSGDGARDVRVGSVTFDVSSFRQPSFRVDVRAPEHAFAGDALRFEVDANYLFGGRLTGGELRYSLARHGTASYPRAYNGFQFGVGDAPSGRGTLEEGVEVLREDGSTVVTIAGDAQSSQRTRVVFEASVTDQAGQTVGADKVVTLYPAAVEVGVRRVPGWTPHAQPLTLSAIVIDRTGAAVAGQTVRGRFVREGYHTFWDRSGGQVRERRELRREVVHECSIRSAAEAASCEHRPARGGTYVLEAEVTDEAGRRTLSAVRTYVAAADEVPDRDPPGTAVTLTSREREYAVGQNAEIAFESPFERARALVTVDVHGVPEVVAVRDITRGAQELSVPLRSQMVPSALVTVTLVRGRVGAPTATHDLLGPDLRLGAIELKVRPALSAFAVNVTAPENARPGEQATIEVAVTRDGQPAQVSLALWAVDEGSLRLTNYERPELDFHFASAVDGDFAWEDLRRSLASRVTTNVVRDGGDGAEEAGALRTLRPEDEILDPTPLWAPTLTTDAQGRARATLTLPARATEYRVMAVVIDTGLGTTGAEATIRTKTDVQVQPTLPRFVTEGDSFEVAGFVHNTGERAQELDVVLRAGDTELARQHLSLAPGRSERVAHMHRVPAGEGTLALRFTVSGGASAEAVSNLPIAPRAVYRRSHARGFVRGTEDAEARSQVTLDLPTNLRGRMDLELAPHPMVGVEALMGVAERAQYGGLAHQAARVMLFAAGVSTSDAAPDVRAARLQQGVEDLVDALRGGGYRPSLADHTRVLHALVLAEQAGATVPAAQRASALTALTRALERPTQGRRSADELTYALRVLVLSGATVAAPMRDALLELRDTLSVGGRASIGLALPDDHNVRATLLDEIKSALPEQIDAVAIDALSSVLEFALRVRPDDAVIGEAVASLLRRVEPRSRYGWYSLAAAADAQRALSAYAALLGTEFAEPPTVLVDGQPIRPRSTEGGRARYRVATQQLSGTGHSLTVVSPARQAVFFAVDAEWAEPLGDRVEDGQFAEPRGAITLHRRYEREDGRTIESGGRVALGEMIRVRLFAYGEADGRVYLYDPFPAGVEAIETLNDDSPRSALRALLGMGPEDDVVGPSGHHAMRSVGDVHDRSLEANGAHFRLSRLGRGLREYTYAVRATSVGRFVAPPAQLEAEDDPSVGGDSAAFVLEVVRE
ncbi:MAG: alpha-2-macroglobulin family protein [Polyangiales bacterium]